MRLVLRPIAIGCAMLTVTGCAQVRQVQPPSPGQPANAHSASVAFTPPSNPFAMPLEPLADSAGDHLDHGMHDMPGMNMRDPAKPVAPSGYVCPMHPNVRSDQAGKCPECGMKLVPAKSGADHDHQDGGAP